MEINDLVIELSNSKTEDEIIKNLIKLVKEHNIIEYKDVILSNPFYKSIFIDVKDIVENEIDLIKETLLIEMSEIDDQLKMGKYKPISFKLKQFKRELSSLIYEVEERKKELDEFYKLI